MRTSRAPCGNPPSRAEKGSGDRSVLREAEDGGEVAAEQAGEAEGDAEEGGRLCPKRWFTTTMRATRTTDAVSFKSEEDECVEEEAPSEEDEARREESDCLEEDGRLRTRRDEEDASCCSESSFRSHSTHASTPGKKRRRAPRPRTPILEEKNIPSLELPKTSEDLLVPNEELLNATSIYEVLRNFSTVLRLSRFRFEDFCAALVGDLLCCETCSAVYHLECVKPPLQEVPEDEWQCEICVAHKVPGVTDCVSEAQKNRPYIRQEPIGYDRHQRKYWFLNRRIIVEEDGEHEKKMIWYYSTKIQLEELLQCLDKDYWEMDLCATLDEMKEEVDAHMDVTEDLTSKARGNNKAYLTAANEVITERMKVRREEQEARRQAQEETEIPDDAARSPLDSGHHTDTEPKEDRCSSGKSSRITATLCHLLISADLLCHLSITPLQLSLLPWPHESQPDPSSSSATQNPAVPEAELPESKPQMHPVPEDMESKQETDDDTKGESARENPAPVDTPAQSLDQLPQSSEPEAAGGASGLLSEGSNGRVSEGGSSGVSGCMSGDGGLMRPEQPRPGRSVLSVLFHQPGRNSFFKRDLEVNLNNLFKLGQEGKYRVYHNQYSTNVLALNKHQHREDHDKRRHLSHKFSLTTASEFKWNGSIHGSRSLTVSTLRLTIIHLETNVPAPFMHPNWASHRTNWNKAVQMCSKAREFALALAILECAIKPVVMLPVWKDSLGHTRMHRMTSMEREDKEKVKKREKKLEDEETLQQATWVKYTIPIKHQVWKQKGEEYRVTGYGGWSWVSKTHVPRFVPRLPGNTNVNYRKELEGKVRKENTVAGKQKKVMEAEKQICQDKADEDKAAEAQGALSEEGRTSREEPQTAVEELCENEEQKREKENDNKDSSSLPSQPVQEELTQRVEQPKEEESITAPKIFYDVVNVSEGFQLRTAYKKKVKPSKLDGLLERRVKQFTLEEKQRLERMRQAALQSKMSGPKSACGVKTEGSTLAKQLPPAVTPTVKEEEKNEGQHVKDSIVKRLNFDQEETDVKTNVTVNAATPSTHSKQTEVRDVQGNGGEVNGGSLGLNSETNYVSEPTESKEITPKPEAALENAKKRGYEVVEQSSGQNDLVNMQSNASPAQVNGQTALTEPGSQEESEVKEPVVSLMNGNVSRNEGVDGPPPLKIPKLENHVSERGDSLSAASNNNQGEGVVPAKLSSSSLSATNDICSSSNWKTSMQDAVTNSNTTDSRKDPDVSGSTNKPGANAASCIAASTNKTSAPVPLKTKPASDVKPTSGSMTISKEYTTRDRVSLLRFSKSKKVRSGTALPSYRKFVTKSSKKSIFILPNDDLKRLARRAAIREVPIFNYNAKPALDIWPYPSPRPTFGITWRYRLQTVRSLAGVSLMLRLLWACLRWDDMAVKPSAAVGTTRKETTDTDITTTEIIKRRDVGPYGIRSEYCIRKIICPLGNRDTPKETPTPQRKGLRSSALRPKKQEPAKLTGPVAVETWVPEEDLELWEIRAFAERLEREKSQGVDSSKTSGNLRTAEEVKAHLENQLKQARLAAQQVREQHTAVMGTGHSNYCLKSFSEQWTGHWIWNE
ncbi:unnamed protein product [Lampetra planeri]